MSRHVTSPVIAHPKDSMHIKIVAVIGGQTYTVEHKGPLALGGDRRRWTKRLIDHVTEQVRFLATRFEVAEPPAAPAESAAS